MLLVVPRAFERFCERIWQRNVLTTQNVIVEKYRFTAYLSLQQTLPPACHRPTCRCSLHSTKQPRSALPGRDHNSSKRLCDPSISMVMATKLQTVCLKREDFVCLTEDLIHYSVPHKNMHLQVISSVGLIFLDRVALIRRFGRIVGRSRSV